jgi:ABC-type nitrate/sulfonate/bicarbonate transport system ATPase subunit
MGSMIKDGRCTRGMKSRIAIAKTALNKKNIFLISKLE